MAALWATRAAASYTTPWDTIKLANRHRNRWPHDGAYPKSAQMLITERVEA
jgi:hypothetical protein